jgi:hypothetical protein
MTDMQRVETTISKDGSFIFLPFSGKDVLQKVSCLNLLVCPRLIHIRGGYQFTSADS